MRGITKLNHSGFGLKSTGTNLPAKKPDSEIFRLLFKSIN